MSRRQTNNSSLKAVSVSRWPVADPALIRRLDVGQAAYIHRGGVTFVQVKRLTAAPPALPREPVTPGEPVGRSAATRPAARPAGREPRTAPPPDAGSLLDQAFGKEIG